MADIKKQTIGSKFLGCVKTLPRYNMDVATEDAKEALTDYLAIVKYISDLATHYPDMKKNIRINELIKENGVHVASACIAGMSFINEKNAAGETPEEKKESLGAVLLNFTPGQGKNAQDNALAFLENIGAMAKTFKRHKDDKSFRDDLAAQFGVPVPMPQVRQDATGGMSKKKYDE